MTFHELIIQSIDSEITQYELEKERKRLMTGWIARMP